MLVISCSVCYHPRFLEREYEELYLLFHNHLVCLHCLQPTQIPDELKSEIRKARKIGHESN
jgi:hypothetical protein